MGLLLHIMSHLPVGEGSEGEGGGTDTAPCATDCHFPDCESKGMFVLKIGSAKEAGRSDL